MVQLKTPAYCPAHTGVQVRTGKQKDRRPGPDWLGRRFLIFMVQDNGAGKITADPDSSDNQNLHGSPCRKDPDS